MEFLCIASRSDSKFLKTLLNSSLEFSPELQLKLETEYGLVFPKSRIDYLIFKFVKHEMLLRFVSDSYMKNEDYFDAVFEDSYNKYYSSTYYAGFLDSFNLFLYWTPSLYLYNSILEKSRFSKSFFLNEKNYIKKSLKLKYFDFIKKNNLDLVSSSFLKQMGSLAIERKYDFNLETISNERQDYFFGILLIWMRTVRIQSIKVAVQKKLFLNQMWRCNCFIDLILDQLHYMGMNWQNL